MSWVAGRRLYLRAPRVFTGTSEEALTDAVVVVDQGLVERVVPASEITDELATAEHVIQFSDATVLPGMVDAHAHLTLTGDRRTYEEMAAEPDEFMALAGVRNLELHLRSGVTTMRDNGGRNRITFWVREAARRGFIRAPRLLLSGRPVTHSAGHFHWCNGVADGYDAIRRAVRELVAEGADHIKIMASGGGTGGNIPYLPSYQADELAEAVRVAHDLRTPTTAHCRAKSSMINAIDAGLDCIEHGEFLVQAPLMQFGSGVASSGTMEYDPAVTERLLKTGTHLSFTMQAGGYDTLVDLRQRAVDGERLEGADRAQRDALEAYFEMKLNVFAALLADGMAENMAISTDAGPFDCAFGRMHWNLELAVQAGMTPAQAILATTAVAARVCHVEDIAGTLTPGKSADVAVVAGNPLHDIRQMNDVRAVFVEGCPVAPMEPSIQAAS